MSAVYLLLLLLPLVSAQTFRWGPCPNPKVQPSFNIQQYLGRWYEIAKLPANFERGKCIEANYAVREDGTIRVYNTQLYKGKKRAAEGTAVIPDMREPAQLGVSFSYFTPYSPYWILTTDYTGLSVVYSCTDIFRIFHIEFAWILGRSRFLTAAETRNFKESLMPFVVCHYRSEPERTSSISLHLFSHHLQAEKMKVLIWLGVLLCLFACHLGEARVIPEGVPYDEPPAVPYWPYSTSDFWNYIEYFRSIGAYNHINEMARAFFAHQHLGDTLGYETNAGHEH
ncbi:hypothetical protein LDENG_00286010 [Xyrichtys novacula]|uniref:Apolipoprotein D n=1 Tax=Xyrichtys novacula TaxID=13765 RepID=A0AAV1HB61_XYRNO|nr:hypothetical protein LDENG_00286010 [Xyrichtys novacula]